MATIPAVSSDDPPVPLVHVESVAAAFAETGSIFRSADTDEWPAAGSWQEQWANASQGGDS